MRWEDERYVRVYVRDTLTWRSLRWEARACLPLLMRKVDRAGILDVGDDPIAAIALVADLPPELVRAALPALLTAGTVVLAGTSICIPNFIEAQETPASSKARKRKSRETARAVKAANSKQIPLRGHEPGQGGVTPYCAVPSRAVPSRTEPKKEITSPSSAKNADRPAKASQFVDFVLTEWPDLANPAAFESRARAAFPAVDPLVEVRKARGWEQADPRHVKHKHGRFFWNWLTTAQQNANRNGAMVPAVGSSATGAGGVMPQRNFTPEEQAQRAAIRARVEQNEREQRAAERELTAGGRA